MNADYFDGSYLKANYLFNIFSKTLDRGKTWSLNRVNLEFNSTVAGTINCLVSVKLKLLFPWSNNLNFLVATIVK